MNERLHDMTPNRILLEVIVLPKKIVFEKDTTNL